MGHMVAWYFEFVKAMKFRSMLVMQGHLKN